MIDLLRRIDPCTQVRQVGSKLDISRPPLGVGDSTGQASRANLRKLKFTNTLYQLAYSQVLLQHFNSVSKWITQPPTNNNAFNTRDVVTHQTDTGHRPIDQFRQLGVEHPGCRGQHWAHNNSRPTRPLGPCPEQSSVGRTRVEYQH